MPPKPSDVLEQNSTKWAGIARRIAFGVPAALLIGSLVLGIASAAAPDDPLEAARSLHEQAVALFETREYEKGMALAERAASARESLLGPEHPQTLASLASLAEFHLMQRNSARAESIYRHVLAACEKTYGEEHAETATALHALGRMYYETALSRAEPLYLRALAIREKLLGPQHPDTAAILHNLGILYVTTAAFAKAEPFLLRALAIRELVHGAEHADTANSVSGLAVLYTHTSAFAKAEQLHRRAIAIREAVLGTDHPHTADAIDNMAGLHQKAGWYSKAEPLRIRALAIRKQALGEEHPEVAVSLNNLALLYFFTGRYEQAEPLLQRAVVIQERALGPQARGLAKMLSNLADVYRLTGAYARAEPVYRRALDICEKVFGAEHPDAINSLNGLGLLYTSKGAFGEAEPLLQRAVEIARKAVGQTSPHTAVQLMYLASMYKEAGDYAKAEQTYRQALAMSEQSLGPQHPRTAQVAYSLGSVNRMAGAYAKAVPLQLRALSIHEKTIGTRHPETAASLRELGLLYWATDRAAQALPLLQRAQDIEAANSRRFLISGSESRNRSYLEEGKRAVFHDVSFSVADATRAGAALGLASVLRYKGLVLDAASDKTERLRRSVQSEDRTLFEQLGDVAAQFSQFTIQGAGALPPKEYRKRLQELASQQEDLEAQLAARNATFRHETSATTPARVASALPAASALIEWFQYEPFSPKGTKQQQWGAPRYMAYVLQRHGKPVAIDLGLAADIDSLAQDFRAAVSNPHSIDVRRRAAALSEKLIVPLRAHLQGVRHLLLSPDAALNLVPMAALLDQEGRYLVNGFEITYLTSGRDLLRMAESQPTLSSNPVVMADPTFGDRLAGRTPLLGVQQRSADLDRSGLSFRQLPGTALEAEAITALLKGENVRAYTRDAATETRLKQLRGPKILHLATHGFFLDDRQVRKLAAEPAAVGVAAENPLLRSGLALAGANQRRSGVSDDGILTALEAARLDLQGTALVVLSACETGVGEVSNGDGVSGLRRGLLLAGARSQVASLWRVADLPTQQLMVSFYQALVKGEGRSTALRHAQQAMLAAPTLSHPYYWAAFVAIGDWTPLWIQK